LTVQS